MMQISAAGNPAPVTLQPPNTAAPAAASPPVDFRDGRATADAFAASLKSLQEQARARGASGEQAFSRPFRVQFEVKVDGSKAQRWLNGTQWTVTQLLNNSHNRGGDCSHKRDGGGKSFARVQSPYLTVEGGGFQQIADVVKRLKDGGARTGRTGAMRIYIRQVDDKTLQNLVGAQVGHEDILYRLARGGGQGRWLSHKKKFAVPLTRMVTGNEQGFNLRHPMTQKYAGVNLYNYGEVEFRYFDSTLRAPALQANVSLVLGMVGPAAEGRLAFTERHPVRAFGFIVGHNRWKNFMRETVGEGPIAQQLKRQFHGSHGLIF